MQWGVEDEPWGWGSEDETSGAELGLETSEWTHAHLYMYLC